MSVSSLRMNKYILMQDKVRLNERLTALVNCRKMSSSMNETANCGFLAHKLNILRYEII